MTRFTKRVERDLGLIADRATPSSTAWEAIQHRIDEDTAGPRPTSSDLALVDLDGDGP